MKIVKTCKIILKTEFNSKLYQFHVKFLKKKYFEIVSKRKETLDFISFVYPKKLFGY